MTHLAHNFGEGGAKSGGTGVKLIQKYSFLNFVANFWDRTNWRNCPFKPREIGTFSHFSPIFPPVSPKNWALPPS